MEKLNRKGEKHMTNEGLQVEIIEYKSSTNCTVRYSDGYIVKNKYYADVKNGKVENPFHPRLFNIGYMGEGLFKSIYNKKRSKSYVVWSDMLRRCYDKQTLEKRPSYKGCSVVKEWHCYQNFAKWFEENYMPDYCLDKDLLFKGNKVYSPDTCCFVPNNINILLAGSQKINRALPLGVVIHKTKYRAQICLEGKTTYLGVAETKEKAFDIYKKAKEEYIKKIANFYKEKLPFKVYEALINYNVETTD